METTLVTTPNYFSFTHVFEVTKSGKNKKKFIVILFVGVKMMKV
jgi:hypothetical protein